MWTEQLSKCSESLQKLRTRPQVILNYRQCQGSTSDVILCVPCFGVSFCTGSPSVCLDDIYLGFGS